MKGKGLHLLFAVALVSLIALALWWSLFISRAIDARRTQDLEALKNRAQLLAIRLVHGPAELPAGDPLAVEPDLALATGCGDGEIPLARLAPRWPGRCLVAAPGVLTAIEARYDRQRLMLFGEGSLLMLLLAVCLLMFYRLVLSERRVRREMDLFFHTVTHELKTPVAGLRALLQSLQLDRVPGEQVGSLAALGLEEADRLEHLVESILTSTRLRRAARLRAEHLDLDRILDELLTRRAELLGPAGARRFNRAGPTGLRVTADQDAVRSVLDNLLDNALKYGGDGTIEVRVEAGTGGRVAVAVTDRGSGFDPAHAELLFEAFRRASRSEVPAARGSGLGLFLARELARRMGGDLDATSAGPEQGSCFRLILPGAEA